MSALRSLRHSFTLGEYSMIKNLRKILKEQKIDYLLINTTDEFLVEYNELSNCARYFVTGFSGSTGDVLLS